MTNPPVPWTPQRSAAAVQHLNRRWSRRALALWQGHRQKESPESVYRGFEDLLTIEQIHAARDIADPAARQRIRHGLVDHYLQRRLMPHETEMQAWSRGAAAHVDGQKIYFRDVIPWCQKSSTLNQRRKLQQETGPLCKLLKPFAVNYWEILLRTLADELGFAGYVDYCRQKKGLDYHWLYTLAKALLDASAQVYFAAMDAWSRDRFRRPLDDLNRFDAMYLLGLGQWDHLCPTTDAMESTGVFHRWGIDLNGLPALHLDVRAEPGKSAQALSIMVEIPDEVYILMQPQGGWIDLETLWHELGHGLSAVYTDPALSVVDRELATTYSLSEVYAFLFQRAVLSRPVLSVLGLPASAVATFTRYRNLKDLSVLRRYAAKLISEYEMFSGGDLADGRPYAQTMRRHTGFYHQPESHLFDLVPEFYCADYLLGWIGEAQLEAHLRRRWGGAWILDADAGRWLSGLWRQGNRLDIFAFFTANGLGELTPEPLLARWQRLYAAGPNA